MKTRRSSSALLVSTWFGCGYSPIAPGTAGSLAACVIGVALRDGLAFAWWQFLALVAVGFAPAVWAATATARTTKMKGPQIVVVDEVLGQWIALAAALPFHWI